MELLFTDVSPNRKRALMALPLTEGAEPRPVVQTGYNATGGRLSPDGHWLAYASDEAGRTEVYLQEFPGPGGKLRISADGGRFPIWARNGRDLFYWNQNRLIAVQLDLHAGIAVVRRQTLFQTKMQQGGVLAQYDIMPDGQHFVLATSGEGENRIAVVMNVPGQAGR